MPSKPRRINAFCIIAATLTCTTPFSLVRVLRKSKIFCGRISRFIHRSRFRRLGEGSMKRNAVVIYFSMVLMGAAAGRAATASSAVTFHKDVLPILQNRCQGCHRPGEIAPMALLTYAQTRPYARAIRESVLLG